jgi:hypothetical protein
MSVSLQIMDRTAIETCAEWINSHADALKARGVKIEPQGITNGKATFWLYGPRHLIDISVWDHAFCLDVLVMDSNTNEMVFSEAGACDTADGVRGRLKRFWSWYASQPTQ